MQVFRSSTTEVATPIVLGIDLGTQSTKLVVYDAAARRVLATAQATHALTALEDGTREQEASWWLDALAQATHSLPLELRQRLVALSVSGQQHGFVPLAADGSVLRPVKLWNDTTTTDECELLHSRLGGVSGAIATAGNPVLPGYTAGKVLWLKRHEPEHYAKLRWILLPHDYLNYVLTGSLTMECGDASGTGFLDIRRRQWSEAVLRAIDPERSLADCLPPLNKTLHPAGRVTPAAAELFGLPAGLMVAAGGGDNMMGAIGTGAVAPGRLTLSLGTSGTLYAYAKEPIVAAGQEFAAFCDSTGGYLPLVCTMNCTAATELIRELVGVELAAFDELLASSSIGAGGITALPFFSGERTPPLPHGKGCFFGLTAANTTRANLLRAVVEATVLGLRTGLAAMQQAGLTAESVAVIGGGARSAGWCQVVADVLQLRVERPQQDEAAAFGAALQALWCYQNSNGETGDFRALVDTHLQLDPRRTLHPDLARSAAYQEQFARYLRHLDMVQNLYS